MLRRQLLKTRITTSTTTVIRLRTNFAPSITISTIGTAATGTAVITGVLQFTAGTPPSTEAIIIHGATPGIIPITPEHIQVHSATTGVIPGIMAGIQQLLEQSCKLLAFRLGSFICIWILILVRAFMVRR